PVYETPLRLRPDNTVIDALHLMAKRSHRAVVVVDSDQRCVGEVRAQDCAGVDRYASLGSVLRPNLLTLQASMFASDLGPALRKTFELFDNAGAAFAPVVDDDGVLQGALTRTGVLRSTIYRPALDGNGRLKVAAAVGINGDVRAKAASL
ncbi:CBS domain-containing protein, partial [Arthrobacter deserti]|nr:CBS domain-containing protein [Arthrobacter deserti]